MAAYDLNADTKEPPLLRPVSEIKARIMRNTSLNILGVRLLRRMKCSYSFSRRAPDLLAHEIATVLSSKSWFDFKGLFDVVYENLRARKFAGGGQENMRLSSYEKLQNLVSAGAVEKSSKQYRGIATGLASFFESSASLNASFAARKTASQAAPMALAVS